MNGNQTGPITTALPLNMDILPNDRKFLKFLSALYESLNVLLLCLTKEIRLKIHRLMWAATSGPSGYRQHGFMIFFFKVLGITGYVASPIRNNVLLKTGVCHLAYPFKHACFARGQLGRRIAQPRDTRDVETQNLLSLSISLSFFSGSNN